MHGRAWQVPVRRVTESEVTLWQQAGTHSLPPTSAVPRQALVCLACEALKGMSNSARRVILKQNTVMVS